MKRGAVISIVGPLAAVLALVGCAEEPVDTPTACISGTGTFYRALESAPGPVRLNGRIPISTCLVPSPNNGDFLTFGSEAVEVATRLGAESKRQGVRGIAAAIQAGYLVGALERGDEESGGGSSVLVDRVRAAASNGVDVSGSAAQSHYEIGYEAGGKLG